MTKSTHVLAAAAVVSLMGLAGCHNGPKTPTGQVVATVDGAEITTTELKQELAGFRSSDPKAYDIAKRRALQNIVARKLVAKEARSQHLDQTPDFAVKQQRLNELLLAEAYQAKILSAVPAATPEDVDRFVAAHPDMFAARKIFQLDQITTPPLNDRLQKELRPVNTLAEAEALLNREHVPFRRATSELDALAAGPQLVDVLLKQGATDLIILPSAQTWSINQVKSSRVAPFTGDNARKYATSAITNDRQKQVLGKTFSQIVSTGRSKVSYAKGYEPPAAPPSAPASQAAPAPAKK